MDIYKFAGGRCDFCRDDNDICLSCKKIIMHEAIKSEIEESCLNLGIDLIEIIRSMREHLEGIDNGIDGLSIELFKARKDFDDWINK